MRQELEAMLAGLPLLPADEQSEVIDRIIAYRDSKLQESLTKLAATCGGVAVEKRVEKYVKLRDARAEFNKVAEANDKAFKNTLEAIEKSLLATANEQGVTGFKTDHGTVYKEEAMHASIADENAFYDFVRTTGDLDFFERRIKIAHIKEFAEVNEGRTPPGLNIFREFTMRVRRK